MNDGRGLMTGSKLRMHDLILLASLGQNAPGHLTVVYEWQCQILVAIRNGLAGTAVAALIATLVPLVQPNATQSWFALYTIWGGGGLIIAVSAVAHFLLVQKQREYLAAQIVLSRMI
jgi:hypothetical protein